ncbi:hypothetical protein PPERSA_08401 [Pseudocohnilembus persalinus]|uniref:Uncharacterized protein n=1 Tax=Pseudocohnilembus persalinus TaxID=266149 RepID=A0A0V0R688_PSEPJ|nr:hypothetical protein PPERSA_08401 [Pseudocohnilembus persalinus]|eukprot:KRX09998.1 hypothetical protein PPERSA_08401 [Pseudocohnilembus persalinus]
MHKTLKLLETGDLDDRDENNVKMIYKPVDEFDYWIKVYSQVTSDAQQKRAKYFSDTFQNIDKQFRDLRQIDINGMKELIDQTIDVADKIWVDGEDYPQIRMDKFLTEMKFGIYNKFKLDLNQMSALDFQNIGQII